MRGPKGETFISLAELRSATLARQLLSAREAVGVVEAVERLAGLQAQEPKPPFIGLWSRVEAFDADDLRAALRDGDLVRGTLMRGTLHIASARDFAAWRAPVSSDPDRLLAVLGARSEGLVVADVLPVARELLQTEPRTFNELRALLQERFPDVNERALGYCSRMLLPLTMVPTEDRWGFARDSRFALTAEPDGGDGRAGLVRRYLAAFGPASVADAQVWSGLRGLQPVFESMRDELEVFTLEGGRRELFDLPDAPRPEPGDLPPRFLPEFDNLLLAHDDRTRVIADEHRPLVATKNLRIKATYLLGGVVHGLWTVKATKTTATLTIEPFSGRLPRGAKGPLTDEAERLLAFLEPEARSAVVQVGAG